MIGKDGRKEMISAYLIEAPYRLIGRRIEKIFPLFNDLKQNLLKANIKVTFQTYVSYIIFFPLLAFLIVFSITPFISFLSGASMFFSIIMATLFGILSWITIFGTLYAYPYNIAQTRKKDLDEELPYISSHMAVLSQGGMPPERIFKSISSLNTKSLKSIAAEESKNIVRDVSLLGLDIMTAMDRSARKSPSKDFADLINGFISVTRSGGDMTKYFLSASREFMNTARLSAKKLIDTLATIAEFYVALMIVFPLLVMIMLSVMGIIGGSIGGIGVMMLMYLISYIAVPIAAVLLLVILDGIIPPR